MSRLDFKLLATATNSRARATVFKTLHSEVSTPIFMPVGTQASVRNISANELESAGSKVLLANTYHLMHRPGKEVFEKIGGIHEFMKWLHSVHIGFGLSFLRLLIALTLFRELLNKFTAF